MYKVGIIGFGKMGSAIIKGAISKNVLNKKDILISVRREEQYLDLVSSGFNATLNTKDIYTKCNIIILAIKPQMLEMVCSDALNYSFEGKCIASILAGVKISKLEGMFPSSLVVRIMPNTPALIGKCVATMSYNLENPLVDDVKKIFEAIGTYEVIEESLMDETLPLNGSMPAYLYLFAKVFIERATQNGVDYDKAKSLTLEAIKASADMVLAQNDSIDTLINNVCSKGGTTIAGLNELYDNGFVDSIQKCYDACMNRSKELAK